VGWKLATSNFWKKKNQYPSRGHAVLTGKSVDVIGGVKEAAPEGLHRGKRVSEMNKKKENGGIGITQV